MTGAKYGQNFLINKNVAEKIVRHLLPSEGPILEVGPGKGVLTDLLIKYADGIPIKAVELDMGLYYKLKDQYSAVDHFEVVNRNILKVDLGVLFPGSGSIDLISNVPYYISHDFIDWVVSSGVHLGKGVLMLQKEFVDKLLSQHGTKDYNAQSIIFNCIFQAEKLFDVAPGSFSPQPKVKSTVFLFKWRPEQPDLGEKGDVNGFYHFLRHCFRNRRKTLLNNLDRQYHEEAVWSVFEDRGINPKIRAEQLTAEDFLSIYRGLPRR